MLQLQLDAPRPVATPSGGAILLADPDPIVRGWIKPALAAKFGARIQWVSNTQSLERALTSGDLVALVVANARMGEDSSLRSLARVRSQGCGVPWIVYTAFEEHLMRILVSDFEGTVLSSRIVHLEMLAEIGCRMAQRSQSLS